MRIVTALLAMVTTANAETYYAHLTPENIVNQVIVADSNFINSGLVGDPANWIETCMVPSDTRTTSKNCAIIGYKWDPDANCFVPPLMVVGSTLNDTDCSWVPPAPEQQK